MAGKRKYHTKTLKQARKEKATQKWLAFLISEGEEIFEMDLETCEYNGDMCKSCETYFLTLKCLACKAKGQTSSIKHAHTNYGGFGCQDCGTNLFNIMYV